MDEKSSKVFDLTKTIIGVVLAAVAAAWISHHYKMLEENTALSMEARKAATSTYYDIIDTVGKRHFYALRAAIGLQYKSEVAQRWDQYDKAVITWNERRYSMFASMNRYFGSDAEHQMYDLTGKFSRIHEQLSAAKKANDEDKPFSDFDPLLQDIYALDDSISKFSEGLQKQLRNGQVDVYLPQPPLTKP